jgi:gluconolactonase
MRKTKIALELFAVLFGIVLSAELVLAQPDGLHLGNLFAAGPGGVYVIAPDGTYLGSILTRAPTGNVAWGDDGSSLFVTSSRNVYRLRLATKGAGF